MGNPKEKGKQWEELVKQYYLARGYTLVAQNYTIRGGELDLIMKRKKNLTIIEVKTLDTIKEFDEYITPNKLHALERTVQSFLQQVDESEFDEVSIDVVLVSHGEITEIYENVTGGW